jgi:hypothetical protein
LTTVVIPWRGGCKHRERALEWVLARYADRHPDWIVVVADARPGPWVKASAVTPAVATAESGPVLVADADVWCDGLQEAVGAIEGGEPWAIPHLYVHRLTEQSTAQACGQYENWNKTRPEIRGLELEEPAYPGMQGGGYVVAQRDTLLDIPLDPRFEGWGQEDISWAMALHFLAGPAWRGHAPLYHLYHPPQDRINRKRGNEAGWLLYRRYCRARYDLPKLRELIEEAKAHGAVEPAQPAVHDHAA